MICFCIEASHARGLGHLYRTLNLLEHFASKGRTSIVLINNDQPATRILEQRSVKYITVDLADHQSDWESALISKLGITNWLNDRLDTTRAHADNVKKNGVKLVTFDDRGTGAALADIHFAPLVFSSQNELQGTRVLTGTRYLALSPEIEKYRRARTRIQSPILVTLGGSDTYGVTVKVVELLKKLKRPATVIVGPAFLHETALNDAMDSSFTLKKAVSSLAPEFSNHDLAITGGGVTAFEASASGLPSIIIANEPHEVQTGQYLAGIGSAVFAGYYRALDEAVFERPLDIVAMSRAGLENIGIDGVRNIAREIESL